MEKGEIIGLCTVLIITIATIGIPFVLFNYGGSVLEPALTVDIKWRGLDVEITVEILRGSAKLIVPGEGERTYASFRGPPDKDNLKFNIIYLR